MSLAVNYPTFFEYQTDLIRHLKKEKNENSQKFEKAFLDDIGYLATKKIKLTLSLVVFFNQWSESLKDKKIEEISLNDKDKISENDIDQTIVVTLLLEAQKIRIKNLFFNHLNPIGISFLTNDGKIYIGSNNDYENICFVKAGLLNLANRIDLEIFLANKVTIIAISIVCRNEDPICDSCYKKLFEINKNMLVIRSNIVGSDIKIDYLSKLKLNT